MQGVCTRFLLQQATDPVQHDMTFILAGSPLAT